MEAIAKRFKLKDGLVAEPDLYLGADIGKFYFADDPTRFVGQCHLANTLAER